MVKALNLIGKQLSLALPLTRSQFDFSLTYNFTLNFQVRVVRTLDNGIHQINNYPADSVVYFSQHLSAG